MFPWGVVGLYKELSIPTAHHTLSPSPPSPSPSPPLFFTVTEMAAGKEESVVGHGEAQKAVTEFDAPKKKGRNKFSIACTILASMTSILLGYGEFRIGCLFFRENRR